jgi:redox-sensing transcriptional repressor
LSYRHVLDRFKSLGMVKIFSDNIAEPLGISASLVRKDFAIFGISGTQKGGYLIDSVCNKIDQILGRDKMQEVVVIGVGRIGEALMSYKGFYKDGIRIVAGFDIDVKKIRTKGDIPIMPIEEFPQFVRKHNVKVAIMSVPAIAAQQTLEILKSSDIQGILNFTPVKFKSTDNLVINNFNIENELVNLIYFVNRQENNGQKQ